MTSIPPIGGLNVRRFLLLLVPFCFTAFVVLAAETPVDTLVVIGSPVTPGARLLPLTAENLHEVFARDGVALVRRGGSLTADLYLDGFRRGDLLTTLDGERHHTACPNRMDAVVGRINPLDFDSVELRAGAAGAQSALAGRVDFRRSRPGRVRSMRGYLEGSFEAAEALDGSVSLEDAGTRLTVRHTRQETWLDGDGRGFSDLYGYAVEEPATLTEVAAHHVDDEWDVTASYTATRDISFPYLMMDERKNDLWSFAVGRDGHRVYVNTAEHLMDNGLRTGGGAMVTDASTTTAGLVGPGYELYARWWDADNSVGPLDNHLMPAARRLGATFVTTLGSPQGMRLTLRGGLSASRVGDAAALGAYRELEPDAERALFSIPFACGLSDRRQVLGGEFQGGVELASEPPELDQLFIIIHKPMGKPHWLGNPELDDPVRAGLRGEYRRGPWTVATHVSYVDGYVQLAKRVIGGVPYQTFAGVDALLASAAVRFERPWCSVGAAWTWGERTADAVPLAEMRPLTWDLSLIAPRYSRLDGRATWTHAVEQTRIDPEQNELSTGAWDRFDLVLGIDLGPARLALAAENLTDETYSSHLSYARNPFAAGLRVHEPGRTLRVRTTFAL